MQNIDGIEIHHILNVLVAKCLLLKHLSMSEICISSERLMVVLFVTIILQIFESAYVLL